MVEDAVPFVGQSSGPGAFRDEASFPSGLAKRMNEATGNDGVPPVQVAMGELAAYASIVENMLLSHEVTGHVDVDGIAWPNKGALYAVMALQGQINPHMIDIVRELTGAEMITLPSSAMDFENPASASDISRYFGSTEQSARDRVRLMRLAWDFIGTEFGNRHQQYEKFYGGASHLVKTNMYRTYDLDRAKSLVDQALRY